MIRNAFVFTTLCTFFSLFSWQSLHSIPPSMTLMPPMNEIYHPVSTTHFKAQESFNKGLRSIFGYNHDLAYQSFEEALQYDPNLAMAYWGMALAIGQNINVDVTPEREVKAYGLVQKALELSQNAWENEKAYIDALATRYTDNPDADFVPLRFKYREAMKKLSQTYPEVLDAATLYCESILDIDPWRYWTYDGKPRDGTLEAVDILSTILKKNPDHIGANHFYIHALEDSPYPERALLSAYRLETLEPLSGHLLHMPCHIFLLVGDYQQAINTSKKALKADFDYVKEKGHGEYPSHYLPHNLFVLSRAYMLQGDYDNALKTADDLITFIQPYYKTMPQLGSKAYVPLLVYLHFHKWNEILAFRPTSDTPFVQTFCHFSRAVAFASLHDLDSAQKEKELMLKTKKELDEEDKIANNPPSKIFELAELVLNSHIALAQNKYQDSISNLTKAADIQDHLYYDEPPAWYFPVENELGKVLIHEKRYTEAEKAFRKGLQSLQRNGELLTGLALSLKGQNRIYDAYWVEREAKAAEVHK